MQLQYDLDSRAPVSVKRFEHVSNAGPYSLRTTLLSYESVSQHSVQLEYEAQEMLHFLQRIRQLKVLPRSGWLSHGISVRDVESIADHSFSVSALSLILADLELEQGTKVNVEHVLRMAIMHDLAESLTFDISKEYLRYLGEKGEVIKQELEESAWTTIVKDLKNPRLASQYLQAQSEYNTNATIESEIVHAADRLDILLQILGYRRRGYPEPALRELWTSIHSSLKQGKIASTRSILREVNEEYRRSNLSLSTR